MRLLREWSEWLGPTAQDHAQASGLPVRWSESGNVVWKTKIPGRGGSSPVVGGDEIWLTTAIEHAAKPEDRERRIQTSSNRQPLTVLATADSWSVSGRRDCER